VKVQAIPATGLVDRDRDLFGRPAAHRPRPMGCLILGHESSEQR
jgi:hypothetical protein